jgi:molecular chaperone DnaK
VLLVGAATRMPTVAALLTDVLGQESAAGVNPDECVAVGASMNLGEILLIEHYPHSLGIETDGPYGDSEIPALFGVFDYPPEGRADLYAHRPGPAGQYTPVLGKNFSFPVKRSLIVTTEDDNQPSVLIQVFEGEREIAAYNRKLGMLELTCLAPAPRGIPQIEVTFEMGWDQILEISAKELPMGASRTSWSISKDARLLRDGMIKKATAELQEYEESYRRKRELDEVKAIATKLINDARRLLSENERVLSESVKSAVNSSIVTLRDALENEDCEELRFKNEKLFRFAQDMAGEIYAASTATTRDRHES